MIATFDTKANLQMQKPSHKEFGAIVDQEILKNYFIFNESGRIEEVNDINEKCAVNIQSIN